MPWLSHCCLNLHGASVSVATVEASSYKPVQLSFGMVTHCLYPACRQGCKEGGSQKHWGRWCDKRWRFIRLRALGGGWNNPSPFTCRYHQTWKKLITSSEAVVKIFRGGREAFSVVTSALFKRAAIKSWDWLMKTWETEEGRGCQDTFRPCARIGRQAVARRSDGTSGKDASIEVWNFSSVYTCKHRWQFHLHRPGRNFSLE